MPHSSEPAASVIEAGVNYIPPLAPNEPERVFLSQSVGHRRSKFDSHIQKVTDIRGHESEYILDTHGFQLVKTDPIPEAAWTNDAEMKAQVYPSIKELLMKTTGASYVHIFGDAIRRDPYQALLDLSPEVPDDDHCQLTTPSMNAHIDQSYYGAHQMIEGILDVPELRPKANNRWGIINVWQPLKPVTREPLAVCDDRSVPDSDLQQTWLKMKLSKDTEILFGMWYIEHSEGHKWYWPSEMQPNEALLFKCFDTKLDGRARRSPHSAIRTPTDHGPTRESVEFRALCFWEHEERE